MAEDEITGEVAPSPPPTSTSAKSSTTESPPTRTTKPGTKRLFLTVYVLLSFLLGLPLLLKSTEIHRSPLPSDSIADLSRRLQSDPPSIPCRFQVVFLQSNYNSNADRLESSISSQLRRLAGPAATSSCGGDASVSVTVDTPTSCLRGRNAEAQSGGLWKCGAVGSTELARRDADEAVDELLDAALEKGNDESGYVGARVYSVVVVEREDDEEMRVVVGKHRHAWIVGKIDEDKVVSVIGKIFIKYFISGVVEDGEAGIGKGEFMPVGLDGNIVLSFSLLNSEPNDWVYDW